ncbi:transferrin-binding protein B [Parvularcula bermudensis HTCC2503]|uniref:Transferrin-binding protein B n=1 Tax=Parvularcula bermudensis (strain ATCC BAA-594 / HTCC2503 / KCTC 12087) TaxID=314260 RepID=E0TEM5_PARBH|nr:transferrin-binding protein-like solute binding protein [Parvularcula bermudensis]ADM08908.1 transferrin-binding protein B [Parvularcula bermudensis HTCC2503]
MRLSTGLFAASSLIALAACSSTGGTPDPILGEDGQPAPPRNLVTNALSYRAENHGSAVSETYDLAVTAMRTRYQTNGAAVFVGIEHDAVGESETTEFRYDAAADTFTIDIDLPNADDAPILVNETWGPLLLLTPKDLFGLNNGVSAVYLAKQPDFYGFVDETLIGGNEFTADAYIDALGAVDATGSGSGYLALWVTIANDLGFEGSERDVGSLPIYIANDPATFGAPGSLAGDIEAATAYVEDLSPAAFSDAQAAAPVPSSAFDPIMSELLATAPESFGVNVEGQISDNDASFIIAVMDDVGGTAVEDYITAITIITDDIEAAPNYLYQANGVTYYQYKTEGDVVDTRFVAAGEWQKTEASGETIFGHFVYGQLTDPDEMPTSGTASYTGTVYGSILRQNRVDSLRGGLNLNTDFQTGALDMTFNADIAYRDDEGITQFIDYADFTGTGRIDDANFDGTMQGVTSIDTSETDSPLVVDGSFEGHFYGPTAQEAGGTFEFSNTEAAATGSFVAVRD